MSVNRKLNLDVIDDVAKKVKKEENFLFYMYVTVRKKEATFYGQYEDEELIGVLAYTDQLPFPAFSFLPINRDVVDFRSLLAFATVDLDLNPGEIGGTILTGKDKELLGQQLELTGQPIDFITMRHVDKSKLISATDIERVKEIDYDACATFIKKNGMNYFLAAELETNPFCAIKQEGEFVSVGGFHFFDKQLVELGNIMTCPSNRGKGYAKAVTSELVRIGLHCSPNVYLSVLAHNKAAVRLYETLGFDVFVQAYMIEFPIGKERLSLS
ncbi:GNAT family N-acetyltransferase [Shouchella sp. JSM 1781072]|uniref:GNAT family N-acetyltransferase n=1 Tax=Shouchella sp. JSM 1781072 TaxID=3344581 RepID=UPI0035C11F58